MACFKKQTPNGSRARSGAKRKLRTEIETVDMTLGRSMYSGSTKTKTPKCALHVPREIYELSIYGY